jgi:ribonuclease HI
MLVTCYTDASYSKRAGGAWAVWLRCDRGRIVKSGSCPDYVTDSTCAELAAIFAGVFLAVRAWPATRVILVCSDSQSALALAGPQAKPARKPANRKLQHKLRALMAERSIELLFRWVKGHQPARAGTAAWLNRNCDKRAGRVKKRRSGS